MFVRHVGVVFAHISISFVMMIRDKIKYNAEMFKQAFLTKIDKRHSDIKND